MAFQRSYIPLARGIDQSVDDRVRVAESPSMVFNGYHKRAGAISKRPGFEELGLDATSGTGIGTGELIRGMFSTGDEMLVHTSRSLYAYNPDLDHLRYRGHVGPCIGGIKPVFSGVHTHVQSDSAEALGYILRIAQRQAGGAGTTITYEIVVSVVSDDEERTTLELYTGLDTTTTAGDQPHSPHACWAPSSPSGANLIGFWVQGVATGAGDVLRRVAYNAASIPVAPPATVTSVVTDVQNAGANIRMYDCVGIPTYGSILGYALSYIQDTTLSIVTTFRNSAHGVLDTETLGALDYIRVAIAYDPDDHLLGLLVVARDGQNVQSVLLYTISVGAGALGTASAPFTVEQFIDDTYHADNLGLAYGIDNNALTPTGRWQCVYSVDVAGVRSMRSRRVKYDLSAAGTLATRFNLVPRARPFWVRGSSYVHADTCMGLGIYTAPLAAAHDVMSPLLECSGLYELHDDKYDDTQTSFVGLWDVGLAPFANSVSDTLSRRGNCNNSWYSSLATEQGDGHHATHTQEVRFATSTIHHIIADAAGTIGLGNLSLDANEMVLDFKSAAMATVVNRGAALIGGSFMAWYDGNMTQEVGWSAPPVPASIIESAETGGFAAGTYFFQAIWKCHDARGIQHRSPPSFLVELTVSGADNGIELVCKTNPATLRALLRPSTVEWYRDINAVRQRAQSATRVIENRVQTSHITETFEDGGFYEGVFLYTTGGELDEISPEGSRIPAVVGGRVFLGDPFRRERVQYSKPYSPGGPNDEAKAPGFNEDFGFVLPDGETVTMLSSIDEKVIIGSRRSIYALVGRGPLNDGSQNDYSGLEVIASDVGCADPRSVVQFPGGLLFLSAAGSIYQLDRGLALKPIGEAVIDELVARPTVTSACLVPEAQHVRFTIDTADGAGSGRVLVFDYLLQAWYVWEPRNASGTLALVASCVHDGVYHIATTTEVFRETPLNFFDPGDTWIPLKVETGWCSGSGPGGWQRLRNFMPMCRREDPCNLVVSLFHDYESTANVTHTFTAATIDSLVAPDSRVELRAGVRRQRCEVGRMRIEDSEDDTSDSGEGFSIAGVTLEWLPRRGLSKVAKEARS